MLRRVLGFAAAILVLVAAPGVAMASSPVTGGGSGFAALEIDQWRADTAHPPSSLSVDYFAQGSTFGRQQFASGNLDFGVSDIPYPPTELSGLQSGPRCQGSSAADCIVYVPVSVAGISFMFNLSDATGSRIDELRLTRRAACKIFTGAIVRWNDPELVASNPQLTPIARDISPVIRQDSAGESYQFSAFCISVAPDVWQAFIDSNPPVHDSVFSQGMPTASWPQQWGRSRTLPYADGVANYVADPTTGANSITFVADGYARVRSFPVASVQNAAGNFVQPDSGNVTVGLGDATVGPDGVLAPNYANAEPTAYLPATYAYAIAPRRNFDTARGDTLGRFLCYAVTTGQQVASNLRYAPLPSSFNNPLATLIALIPGAPSNTECLAASGGPSPVLPDLPLPALGLIVAAVPVAGYLTTRRRRLHRVSTH